MTDKFIVYLNSPRNNSLISNYNNSIKENKVIKYKEPPKRRTKICKEENLKINNQKGKTKIEKKKINQNIAKRKSLNPNNYQFKNIILENNYQNNFSINSNSISKNNSGNKNNPSISTNNTRKNKNKKTTIHFKNNSKKFSDDMYINSNEQLNKYRTSNPSFNEDNKTGIMVSLKEENNVNMKEYLSTDPDDMDYDDAIKLDKRTFCQFFSDKLKVNQTILNTFFTKDPLRPRPLKIILFILVIDLYLFINGLFFNEDYISQMFTVSKDEGIMPFIERFMERFLYITLVGVIINYIIECFFVDEKKIKQLYKREKDNILVLKYEIARTIKNI